MARTLDLLPVARQGASGPNPRPRNARLTNKTCLLQITEKGTFKITGGTGRYKGASGTGTYLMNLVGIGAKLKSGACNPSQSAVPVAWHQEINAVGSVKLP